MARNGSKQLKWKRRSERPQCRASVRRPAHPLTQSEMLTQSTCLKPLRLTPAVCAVCGIEDTDPIAVGEDFEYHTSADSFLAVRCNGCGLVYLNPRPADSEFTRIYPNHYHAFSFRAEEYGFVHRCRRWIESRRLLRWLRGIPDNAQILDFGCGDGFHLRLIRDQGRAGWRNEGVDADSRAVASAVQAGLNVRLCRSDADPLPSSTYDAIFLIMTVEHLSEPGKTLVRLKESLKPGGRLIVVTDNCHTLDAWIFRGRHWGGYHFPRHFNLFDRKTLTRLAQKSGLEVRSVSTSFSPVNWVYSIRNWLDDWGAPRWLVNRFSLKAPVSLAFFTVLDLLLTVLGFGSMLVGQFHRPPLEP